MTHGGRSGHYRSDPTAIIEDGGEIGDGTRIWHFAVVRTGSRIGKDCTIGDRVFVDSGAVIGDRVKIQNGVSVYDGVVIGDGVFVGPEVVFTNDRYPRALNEGGNPSGRADWDLVGTKIEMGASIGANATICCGVTIGAYSMVGAGSVVTRSTEPYQLVVGNPARHAGWVCRCGRPLPLDERPPATGASCEACREPGAG